MFIYCLNHQIKSKNNHNLTTLPITLIKIDIKLIYLIIFQNRLGILENKILHRFDLF
jgi:hypothetical protein